MGTFSTEVKLPKGIKIKALVDTGATFSKLPSGILEKVGVKKTFETKVELGDGRKVKRQVGYVTMKLNHRSAPVPVMFGKQGEIPLIGATTLEILGLIPDPIKKILVETIHLEVVLRFSNE